MKDTKGILIYGVVGFVVGVVITLLFAANAITSNNMGMMRMMGMHSTNRNMSSDVNAIDAHFIEQMIPHHEDAITMSKLALTKATKTEVKELAQSIIVSQQKEIDQMRAWYKDWYGKEVPTGDNAMSDHNMRGNSGMHMGMMGDKTDMERLENAEDFDRAFVEEMIPHHQMAVMMASMLKGGTDKPEMKKLADDIVKAQNQEIDQMRQWLTEWEK